MTTQLTPQGFERDTLATILERLKEKMRGIYGANINLDADTQDGQALAIFANEISNVLQVAEDVYNSFNPSGAVGASLFRLGLLNGIQRLYGSYSTVALNLVIRQGATVYAGAIVEDEVTAVKYALTTDVGPSGSSSTPIAATGQALEKGTLISQPGNVTKIVTPSFGWTSVTNPSASSPSSKEETEEQFRIRRFQSVAAPSVGMTDGLRGALANLTGIGRVRVWENTTSSWKDAKAGDSALAPHSLAVVVQYAVTGVKETIWRRKSMGVTLTGAITETVIDAQGDGQLIKYSVATSTSIIVSITYREIPGEGFSGSVGQAAVKAALVKWFEDNQDIGADVVWSYLFTPINAAVPGRSGKPAIEVLTLQIGIYGEAAAAADVPIAWNAQAVLSSSNITMVAV